MSLVCPQVHNAACEARVRTALVGTDGVLPESIVVGTGRVTVTYDSMKVAIKNLECAVAGAGFDAGDIAADTEARKALPADCRLDP